jgi:hypothetical protein
VAPVIAASTPPWAVATALAFAASARVVSAASYDFVVLARNAGPLSALPAQAPSIDDDGSVAFYASAGGAQRVLAALEPGAASLADFVQIAAQPEIGSVQVIGSFVEGHVSFTAFTPSFSSLAVYRGDGVTALETLYTGPFASSSDPPAANRLDELSLLGSNAVLITDGADTFTLFASGEQLGNGKTLDAIRHPAPDIDDGGSVTFFGSYTALEGPICDDAILLSGLVNPIEIATGGVLRDDCSFHNLDVTIPIASNDLGSAAFVGDFVAAGDTVKGVFVNGIPVWDASVQGFGASPSPGAVALNDLGTVAFRIDSATIHGVFTGNDPIADEVLAVGDPLCGSTVSDLSFQRYGLNDADQLAFYVQLADSRKLIVRAVPGPAASGACITTVPEPGTGLAGFASLVALAAVNGFARRGQGGEGAVRSPSCLR